MRSIQQCKGACSVRGREGLDAGVLLLRRQGVIAEGESVESRRLSGGTIAQVVLVTARDGRQWVVKQIPGLPASALAAEVEGLSALGASGTVAVPRVYHQGDDAIVMQALHPSDDDSPTFWQRLGQDIAGLHAATRTDRHGWPDDNWLGGATAAQRLGGRWPPLFRRASGAEISRRAAGAPGVVGSGPTGRRASLPTTARPGSSNARCPAPR